MYYFIANDEELIGVLAGDGAEIVAYMFTARLAHALQAIDHLRERIDDEKVPCAFLHAEYRVYASQGDNLLTTLALDVPTLVLRLQGGAL